jgi:ABC-type Na+ efflux pump permease subunit
LADVSRLSLSALKRRLERDRPLISTLDAFKPKEVLNAFISPHVLILFVVFFLGGTLLYGLALFLPSIVRQLGFGRTESQLLSVGPFAVGFVG